MKVPQIFILGKNLNEKMYELLKDPEDSYFENLVKPDLNTSYIVNKAKEVARQLGERIEYGYAFKNKKTGFSITFQASQVPVKRLIIMSREEITRTGIVVSFLYEKHGDCSWEGLGNGGNVLTYNPGRWEVDLEYFYTRLRKK